MKKVAIISTEPVKFFTKYSRGGGEILFENIIKQFSINPDFEIFIFYPEDDSFFTENQFKNITFIKISAPHDSKNYMEEIKRIAETLQFDLILNHNMYNLYGTTFLQCHSYAYRVNNIFPLLKPIKYLFSKKKLLKQNGIFKNANNFKYLTVSERVKKDYITNLNIKQENIKVVYPGCSLQNINLSDIKQKDKITIGIIAGSSINKGSYTFLIACGLLKLIKNDFLIKVIAPKYTKDILMQSLIRIFRLKDIIEVLPFQEDMTDFYQNIDVLVLPSLNEAFGLVVLEAMSFAKPAIVSSTAGSSEIINSSNGFIFNRHSFLNFIFTIKKVINLYNNNFEKFKEYMYQAHKTSQNYSWENFAESIVKNIIN